MDTSQFVTSLIGSALTTLFTSALLHFHLRRLTRAVTHQIAVRLEQPNQPLPTADDVARSSTSSDISSKLADNNSPSAMLVGMMGPTSGSYTVLGTPRISGCVNG